MAHVLVGAMPSGAILPAVARSQRPVQVHSDGGNMYFERRALRAACTYIGLIFLWQVPTALAQDASVEQLEQQIAKLQLELDQKKQIAAARAAIAAEAEAARKANEARAYLASVTGPAANAAPLAPQPANSAASAIVDIPAQIASGSVPVPQQAETTTTQSDGTIVEQKFKWSQDELANDSDGKTKFGGLEFGIGLGFTTDLGRRDRIGKAELINNAVRVTDSENTRARLLLESHYFFTPTNANGGYAEWLGIRNYSDEVDSTGVITRRGVKNWGVGPFIALQAGEGELVQAVGAGLMFGLRRPGDGSGSFNLGVGVLYDMNVRTLGDGIVENQPLPAGETEIRYKERSQSGLMILSSYSF